MITLSKKILSLRDKFICSALPRLNPDRSYPVVFRDDGRILWLGLVNHNIPAGFFQ
jgi:hypothetical protein